MIGDFFTKPLGGAKFRRFRNIIMNLEEDEYGPVDVDELTAIHHEKIKKRYEMTEGSADDNKENERSDPSSVTCGVKTRSQECVGGGTRRTNILWAAVRTTHKKNRGETNKPTDKPTYLQALTNNVSGDPRSSRATHANSQEV